ncbi:hypothetical protein G6F47_007244 [Rhizopus delemar]|uniref:Uncharacterized protein n=1 Tax=Rhizopus oryzae TaxID=64495 RepID=A0A9P6Y5I7_RHIOR|nr:hypothetical protein G6F51_008888 [Rhizopus arrhizus]KAG1549381.1 hypothetical protein G6F49_009618 [Rhizopus delemar]KAG1585789.1 hypothetical protein G6F48_007034 [Rhizopus delemar]KAG1597514.1 hypothetical protein G6F47_007244 [Rhizopus delemar]KAG1636456.1 hypothetical protein G6F44_009538 [Rhizopus delemar]
MNQLSSIGINPKGFSPLLATRFYIQIVRAQLEYGLAINKITSLLAKKLEDAQNICLRRIFGGSSRSSVKVMLHLTKLPTMQERTYILQAQFLLRSLTLPDDTLLTCLLPHIRRSDSHSCWYKLSKSPLWAQCLPQPEQLDKRTLKKIQLQFRQDNLNQARSSRNSILLSQCRPTISLDPILWLPMTRTERNICVRWRLGWLPGGKLEPCPRHPTQILTKQHAVRCLDMHHRLQMPETVQGPLSFLLNRLPNRIPCSSHSASPWFIRWPAICTILYELDYLFHRKDQPSPPFQPGQRFLDWLPSSLH